MEISDDLLRRQKHVRDAHGRIRQFPADGIIPDGWSVVVPLALKDNALSGAKTSDDDFAQLPRGFFAKCCRAEGLLGTSEPFVVEGAIASLERLAREAETLSQGGALPWDHDYDPGPTRAAAVRVAQHCSSLAAGGRHRLAGLLGRPVEREPETAEEAHALMRERMRNAWRTAR
jgi:hypothetical protein